MKKKLAILALCVILVTSALVIAIPGSVTGWQKSTAPPPYGTKYYNYPQYLDARAVWFSPTELNVGEQATIYVQTWMSYPYYSHNVRAWVDWNQDGDFTDPGEQVYQASHWGSSGYTTKSRVITVPDDAEDGVTWVRAVSENWGYPTPTGSSYFGGVVDAQVVVHAGIPAIVDVHPETLNLDSMGNWVSVEVEDFPDDPDYDPSQVIEGTVTLDGIGSDPNGPSGYEDGAYKCKVDRLVLEDSIGAPGDSIELEVKGDVADTSFKGTCTIRAIHGI
jgi:Fe-S-cluster formation regulator IscX/YfhJ